MTIRQYEDRDFSQILRIWMEAGWLEGEKDDATGLREFLADNTTLVGEIHDTPECSVSSASGRLLYQDTDLSLTAITAVTTGYPARRQGVASRVTARAIAQAAEAGAVLSGLGMFEQGFYNKLGFGTGAHDRIYSFDPAHLNVPGRPRPPHRITTAHWNETFQARAHRQRLHGGVVIDSARINHAEMLWTKKGFGLGYFKDGRITHYLWGKASGEFGPHEIWWMAFENDLQLLELLQVIKTLSDQVHLIVLTEPSGLDLQDFLTMPFRFRNVTEKTTFENSCRSFAESQYRILNLSRAVEHLRTDTSCTFNLTLDDPIAAYLDEYTGWRGIGGEYTVKLGSSSGVTPGHSAGLPVLNCCVGNFTRLWLGSSSARNLSFHPGFQAPDSLISTLDCVIRLPYPRRDWSF
jgi:GNAT superfamily N-acetyltransferase